MNRSLSVKLLPLIQNAAHQRGLIFGGIILSALLGFEIFNFSSTSFALRDILGDLAFGPFKWATVLALAFCGIDFAGIARIFTPEKGRRRTEGSVLPLRRVVARGGLQRDPHVVGRVGSHCQPHQRVWRSGHQQRDHDESRADLRRRDDPAHPRVDHRFVLAGGRPHVHHRRIGSQLFAPRIPADVPTGESESADSSPGIQLEPPGADHAESSVSSRAETRATNIVHAI